jgi:hypothetical protein
MAIVRAAEYAAASREGLNTMSQTLRRITIAALVLLAACGTTTFTSTWKAPGAAPISPIGKKVAAVFVSRDEGQRRAGEDALAADLTQRGAIGIAAYTVVPAGLSGDGEAARQRLRDAGANGAVIMRVVGKDQQITYTPGMSVPVYYGGFGPYWGYGWGRAYEPGTLTTDTYVSVETLVYSLQPDKLLWASTSRTANPKNLNTLINEVADATAKEMAKQGLLAQR